MIIKKIKLNKPKVIIFQGSPRDIRTCPNMESKTQKVIDYILDTWYDKIDFEVIDLSVNQNKKPNIQPCKGCVSTAGGYHCHWKCVSSDQRVHTKFGFKPISELVPGDILQDGNKVLKVVNTSNSEQVWTLKLDDGRTLEITKDHKILSENLEWKELKDFKIGDRIPIIETDNIFNDTISPNIYLNAGLEFNNFNKEKKSPLIELVFIDSENIKLESFNSNTNIFNFLNGWISERGILNNKGIILPYNNFNILRDFQLILSRVNIMSTIEGVNNNYFLKIEDRKSIKIINEKIKLYNPKKEFKLNYYLKNKWKKTRNKFSKIKSIEILNTKSVYDIEVSNSHQFNCEGIKIHNCSCYYRGDSKKPDLLSELDVYTKLENCDAFVIFSPIHWHSLSSQVKTLFDRLVCSNLTLTVEEAKDLMGSKNIKNSQITGEFSKSGEYDFMLKNHLEGKFCGFYVHGDDGANEYSDRDFPKSYSKDQEKNLYNDPKSTVMPFVLQMKYSGVHVPEELIQAFYINKNIDYYTANQNMVYEDEFFERADILFQNLLDLVNKW